VYEAGEHFQCDENKSAVEEVEKRVPGQTREAG